MPLCKRLRMSRSPSERRGAATSVPLGRDTRVQGVGSRGCGSRFPTAPAGRTSPMPSIHFSPTRCPSLTIASTRASYVLGESQPSMLRVMAHTAYWFARPAAIAIACVSVGRGLSQNPASPRCPPYPISQSPFRYPWHALVSHTPPYESFAHTLRSHVLSHGQVMPPKRLEAAVLEEEKAVLTALSELFAARGLPPRLPKLALSGGFVEDAGYAAEHTPGVTFGQHVAARLVSVVNEVRARQSYTRTIGDTTSLMSNVLAKMKDRCGWDDPGRFKLVAGALGIDVSAAARSLRRPGFTDKGLAALPPKAARLQVEAEEEVAAKPKAATQTRTAAMAAEEAAERAAQREATAMAWQHRTGGTRCSCACPCKAKSCQSQESPQWMRQTCHGGSRACKSPAERRMCPRSRPARTRAMSRRIAHHRTCTYMLCSPVRILILRGHAMSKSYPF